MNKPTEIFISYAHEDLLYLKHLRTRLVPLQREELIQLWDAADISPGTHWRQAIKKYLETAQVILLLISPDFMASEYCYSIEMKRAMERHERGEAKVIPVILRTTDNWQGAPFGQLQAVPRDAKGTLKPIQKWGQNRDDAYASVVDGIRQAIKDLTTPPSVPEGDMRDGPSAAEPLVPRNEKPILRRSDDEAIGEELPSPSVSEAEHKQLVSPPSAGIERNKPEVIPISPEAIPNLPRKTPTLFERLTRRRVLLRLAGGTAGLAILGGAYSCYQWIHPPPSSPVSSPFYVYTDANARENHYVPSGFMGDYGAIKLTGSAQRTLTVARLVFGWTIMVPLRRTIIGQVSTGKIHAVTGEGHYGKQDIT